MFVLGDQILALTGTGSRTIQLDEGTGEWVERLDLEGLTSSSEGSPITVDLPNGDVMIVHVGTGVILSPTGERRPVPAGPGGSGNWSLLYATDDSVVGRVWDQAAQAAPAVQLHLS